MTHRVASRGGGPSGLAPLCVKDKRKAQAAAAAASAAAATANGQGDSRPCRRGNGHKPAGSPAAGDAGTASCCASGASPLHSPCRPAPVMIERSEIIRLASQYTPCAGCSAAVKGLLQRPIEELRLVNAVVEECGRGAAGGVEARGDGRHARNGGASGAHSNRSCGHGCEHRGSETPAHSCAQATSSAPAGLPRALCLREAYLTDRARLDQLLETFPLEPLMKKVQPKGVGLRCEIHRRNGGQATAEGWEWEDAWDRLPGDMRLKVAAIDVDALEAAMHQATSTHRFCADCKHNVVTAFDILTCKCDVADIDNDDEFLPELFWPFTGRIGPVAGDLTGQKALLSCPLEDVEELICWHEDFDSREYTRSSQRHAATLEHGQREIRSIVGSVLLAQLRTNYHNHLAQVQGEQYLFALVLHAIRTRIEGSCRGLRSVGNGAGNAWLAGLRGGPSACPGCGGAADPSCPMCVGTGVSLSDLGFVVDDDDKKAKTKSKKKRERKARAKAAKKTQDTAGEDAGATAGGQQQCNGHGNSNGGRSGEGAAGGHSDRQAKAGSRESAGGRTGAGASKVRVVTRQRAGSLGIESAGSLLSMLDDANSRGGDGEFAGDDDGDEGIDEDLVREMERLRMQKAQTNVQLTRAALRSNLQKNFDQLLVSSTAREARGKA